jgi:Putative Actinobacterial Holin-X, holin superfamily III
MMAEAPGSEHNLISEPGTAISASPAPEQNPREKTLPQLLNDLSRELTDLVHQELELAKTEVTVKGKRLGKGVGWLGGAAVMAFLALAAVVACIIAALSAAMPLWLAALVVGAVLLAIAAGLGLLGKADLQRASPPVPEEAVESAKEDVAWLRTQVKSAKP